MAGNRNNILFEQAKEHSRDGLSREEARRKLNETNRGFKFQLGQQDVEAILDRAYKESV